MFGLAPLDLFWSVVLLAGLVLLVSAIVSIVREKAMSAQMVTIWLIVVVVAPVVGPLVWFALRSSLHKNAARTS